MFKRGKLMVDLVKKQKDVEESAPDEIVTGKNTANNSNCLGSVFARILAFKNNVFFIKKKLQTILY